MHGETMKFMNDIVYNSSLAKYWCDNVLNI